MQQICHSAVTSLATHKGDLIFSNGEMPEEEELRMFFLVEGRLIYMHHDLTPRFVRSKQWICEGALWVL